MTNRGRGRLPAFPRDFFHGTAPLYDRTDVVLSEICRSNPTGRHSLAQVLGKQSEDAKSGSLPDAAAQSGKSRSIRWRKFAGTTRSGRHLLDAGLDDLKIGNVAAATLATKIIVPSVESASPG